MRRSSIYLLVIVLGLVTAIALLQLGELLTARPLTSQVARGDDNAALVRGFYDAVNATLETGQSRDLDHLLAADFVEHSEPMGGPPTRAEFIRRLVALHATYPRMRLSAQDVFAQGDMVVAEVRVEGETPGAFLSLPLSGQPSPWGTVDVFRIAAGKIAEHWGGQEQALALESLQQASLDVPDSDLQNISLARTTVAPGGQFDTWTVLGPEVTYLETGQLTAVVASGGMGWRSTSGGTGPLERVSAGVETRLKPGDLLLLPEGIRATVRNDESGAATFLTIALRKPGGSSSYPSASVAVPGGETPVVATTDIASGPSVALPSGPAVLGLGRATIAPGANFPVASSGAAFFVVEAGNLGLAKTNGTVWSRQSADGTITTTTDGILDLGDAIMIGPGASGELRNAGDAPLVLLVVTITPVNPTAT